MDEKDVNNGSENDNNKSLPSSRENLSSKELHDNLVRKTKRPSKGLSSLMAELEEDEVWGSQVEKIEELIKKHEGYVSRHIIERQLRNFFSIQKKNKYYRVGASDIVLLFLDISLQEKIILRKELYPCLQDLEEIYDQATDQEQDFIQQVLIASSSHTWFTIIKFLQWIKELLKTYSKADQELKKVIESLAEENFSYTYGYDARSLSAFALSLETIIPKIAWRDEVYKQSVISTYRQFLKGADNQLAEDDIRDRDDLIHKIAENKISLTQIVEAMFFEHEEISEFARLYIKDYIKKWWGDDLPLSRNEMGLLELKQAPYFDAILTDSLGQKLMNLIDTWRISIVLRYIVAHFDWIVMEWEYWWYMVFKSLLFSETQITTRYELPISEKAIKKWSQPDHEFWTDSLIWLHEIEKLCGQGWFGDEKAFMSNIMKDADDWQNGEDFDEEKDEDIVDEEREDDTDKEHNEEWKDTTDDSDVIDEKIQLEWKTIVVDVDVIDNEREDDIIDKDHFKDEEVENKEWKDIIDDNDVNNKEREAVIDEDGYPQEDDEDLDKDVVLFLTLKSEIEEIVEELFYAGGKRRYYGTIDKSKEKEQRIIRKIKTASIYANDLVVSMTMEEKDWVLIFEKHYRPLFRTLSNGISDVPRMDWVKISSDEYYKKFKEITDKLPELLKNIE